MSDKGHLEINEPRAAQAITAPMRVCLAGAVAFLTGGGLLALSGGHTRHAILSWLVVFAYYLSVSLGAIFFVMLHHLTGARWSVVLRRLAETLMMCLPFVLLMGVPLLFLLRTIYPWADPDVLATDALVRGKTAYLNPVFFTGRFIFYGVVWLGLARMLYRRSLTQDENYGAQMILSMRRISPLGLVLMALTISFFSFDWLMSLDPRWFSTIFGVYYFTGAFMAVLAALVLIAMLCEKATGGAITVEHYHDLGKLLFGFVIFWAYIAFSQLVLIWMGNIPEETQWFKMRWEGGWMAMSILLIVGHFILPFLILLPRTVKRFKPLLALVAFWMLWMHYIDIYWLVMPSVEPRGPAMGLADLLLFAGGGCLVAAFFVWRLNRHPVLPVGDPWLAESKTFINR